MNKTETIAMINDPEVTLGHLEKRNIITLNAWEINWKDLDPHSNYILLGGHMGAYQSREYSYLKSEKKWICLLYTSPSPRDATLSRMPSSA